MFGQGLIHQRLQDGVKGRQTERLPDKHESGGHGHQFHRVILPVILAPILQPNVTGRKFIHGYCFKGGTLEVLGIVGLPLAIGLVLILLPFLDRSPRATPAAGPGPPWAPRRPSAPWSG